MPQFFQRPLLSCAQHFANKARLCLLTLMIFLGVTWGLWQAHPQRDSSAANVATRSGGTATSLCKHASLAFRPNTSVQQMGQILREEDAYILYGPDEFSEYQVRFGTSVPIASALLRLQSHPHIQAVTPNTACQ